VNFWHVTVMRSAALLAVVSLCLLLFFFKLADRDLWSSHEARAAQDAQSILFDQQWGLPHLFDGKIELQKPPLYYWLVAGIARLRGGAVDAWAVRLPAALAALGTVLLLYGLGVGRGRATSGLAAAMILATALHFTWLARVGRIDMPLTLATALTSVGFYRAQRCWAEREGQGCWPWMLLAYLAAALALLLKGPIGVLLPAGVAITYLWLESDRASRRQWRHWLGMVHKFGIWWGIPLVLAIAIPWFVWANWETNGRVVDVFLWKHNVERALSSGNHAAYPWWFYGPQLAVDFLPWSLLLPVSIWMSMRRGWWRLDPEARFGLVWLVAMTVLLSCSRFKRSDYLLPAYPGAALFLGCILERWYVSVAHRRMAAAAFAGMLATVALGWTVYLDDVLPRQEPQLEFRSFAQEIRRRAPAPQMIIFFRAEAHALAFHVGRQIDTILEWENLDVWASRPETWYVVMPPENAAEWPEYLRHGQLEEVVRSVDLAGGKHVHPLVLMRTRPGAGPLHPERSENARSSRTRTDRPGAPLGRFAGIQPGS
jgi:4-amino-4-deoxy-L-arabinose transferase-like glycosyltransferase